jgi:hypothetical protein
MQSNGKAAPQDRVRAPAQKGQWLTWLPGQLLAALTTLAMRIYGKLFLVFLLASICLACKPRFARKLHVLLQVFCIF